MLSSLSFANVLLAVDSLSLIDIDLPVWYQSATFELVLACKATVLSAVIAAGDATKLSFGMHASSASGIYSLCDAFQIPLNANQPFPQPSTNSPHC